MNSKNNSKYKDPKEYLYYLKEEFGLSVFINSQKCLAIMSDMFEGGKQVTFLLQTAFNNNVYVELLKARNSTSENKYICIERAIKILTDNCGIDKEKATNLVGWLASFIYLNEWNSFISKSYHKDEEELINEQRKQTPIKSREGKYKSINNNQSNKLERKNMIIEPIKIEMVYCSAGSFIMGSPQNELGRNSDEIQHQVIISKPFMIGKYPITQKQYKDVMKNNPSNFKGDNNPVENINWNEAKEFCEKLNSLYKLTNGYKFNLPTEAQWEYACRAGTTTSLNNNRNLTSDLGYCKHLIDQVAWYSLNSGCVTHPVGMKKSNDWGIYDMHGNVWEWCRDWYSNYPSEYVINPVGNNNGNYRVYRGGSWFNNSAFCRSAIRGSDYPNCRNFNIGFRIALVPIVV